MPQSAKIITCCYCGTRAAMVLDKARHELTCSRCGAPLHDIKRMPVQAAPAQTARGGQRTRVRVDWDAERRSMRDESKVRRGKKPVKRRKTLGQRVLSEIWDVVEDIFD